MAKPKQQHITSTIRKYTVTIVGMTPYSQSKMLLEKRGVGEDWDSYEARVWQQKMHVEGNDPTNEDARIVIPASALSQCVAAYAQLRGEKIVGKGNKTWTKLFLSGVRVLDDAPTSTRVRDVYTETNMCDSQGNKGSSGGTRVARTFPCIAAGWKATAKFVIVDPEITQDKFHEYLTGAGFQIGLGRWRPQNGGSKGIFEVEEISEIEK